MQILSLKQNYFSLLCTHNKLNRTDMINPKKKISLHVTAIVCIVLATTFFNSCNSNDYNDEQMYDTKLLIDTIATSDEFWEFERNSELLSDKFQAYTSTLSAEEYNKLMENLNDDDYMEEFIGKANLEKELQQMNEAKENLLLHTGFSKLSEDERMLLFMQYAESREFTGKTLIKTRTEGNANSCETNKQIAYAHLIIFFELLARITLVIGAISIFPQEPYSNKRVWFYYIIMGGSLTIIDTFIRLAGTLQKLLF